MKCFRRQETLRCNICGCSLVAKPQLPKLKLWVRFPSSAPYLNACNFNDCGRFYCLRKGVFYPCFTLVLPCFAHVFRQKSGQQDRWFCMIWYLKENLRQSLLRVVPFLKWVCYNESGDIKCFKCHSRRSCSNYERI